MAGQNVIARINVSIAEAKEDLSAQVAEFEAAVTTQNADFKVQLSEDPSEMKAGNKALHAVVESHERILWRTVQPLLLLLSAAVLGYLFR